MDSIRELDELYNKLEELKRDFNNQLNGMECDLNEFHKILINLSKKYPEQSELLEFIVFINDKLETNQTQYKQIISDAINRLISYKQIIITNYNNRQLELNENTNTNSCEGHLGGSGANTNANTNTASFFDTLNDNINILKEIKWTVISIMVIVLIVGTIISPKEVKSVLKEITPFVTTATVADDNKDNKDNK